MVTFTVPLTVDPDAGALTLAPSGVGFGGGLLALLTLIEMLPEPVLPVASRAVAVSVWGPLGTVAESHGIETGPLLDVVVVATLRPATVRVYVLDVPLEPSSHNVTHEVPVTVAPLVGCVMKTPSVPVAGGGGGGWEVFDTVTVAVAVALAFAASVMVAVRVCPPFAEFVVFHDTVFDVAFEASVVPSTVSVYR